MKLRLVVARHGEMDAARWWNTDGVLGHHGEALLKRGFPKTYHFVQARIAFEVARARCSELFDPPGCMTLWHLPAEIEDRFEDCWHDWLGQADAWAPVFETVAQQSGEDLLTALAALDLLSASQRESVGKLRRSAENRAVALSGIHSLNDDTLTLLAAAFARGEAGTPAVPYARLDG